jgi:iron-sulfur cluster assembly protein
MALDELRDNDGEYEVDGFKYVVNNDFMKKATPIKIDFSEYGFRVDSAIDFGAAGCSGCGTQNSCGS